MIDRTDISIYRSKKCIDISISIIFSIYRAAAPSIYRYVVLGVDTQPYFCFRADDRQHIRHDRLPNDTSQHFTDLSDSNRSKGRIPGYVSRPSTRFAIYALIRFHRMISLDIYFVSALWKPKRSIQSCHSYDKLAIS